LVTHHVHLLSECDLVVVLDDGNVKAIGTFDEIQNSGIDLENLLPSDRKELNSSSEVVPYRYSSAALASPNVMANKVPKNAEKRNHEDAMIPEEDSDVEDPRAPLSNNSHERQVVDRQTSYFRDYAPANSVKAKLSDANNSVDDIQAIENLSEYEEEGKDINSRQNQSGSNIVAKLTTGTDTSITANDENSTRKNQSNKAGQTLTTLEEKATGDVSLQTYMYYILSGGIGWFGTTIILSLLAQCFVVLSSFYLVYWGKVSVDRSLGGSPLRSTENIKYVQTFAWISMLGVFLQVIRGVTLANHRLGTSEKLHNQLTVRILAAPVAFFDVTPLGRILNRFSSDMLSIDEELSQSLFQLVNAAFGCFGAIGAIVASTKGSFMILLIPLVFLYNHFQKYFRKTNTAVARLEAVSRSPIYADFSQALNGANTIRAYQDEKRFIDKLECRVDVNTIAAMTVQLNGQWLALRLDLLGSILTFCIALVAVAAGSFIPAGYLAVGLTYSFQITFGLKFAVRMMATVEAQINSVERVKYYLENVDQEGDPKLEMNSTPEKLVPLNWPEGGKIVGNNVHMRYRDGPLVLKGVNFIVGEKNKVGIAGRTGSGKSSLMIALFRISELAEGSITIDGVDISKLPLRFLRSKLGIIPQDPVMFSATVRFNLDPFSTHSDKELWDILESVNMKEHVLSLPNKLSEEVAEGGDNFSAGQRQLICIGRALLRKPKILVLDEATASIDNATDALIQTMVRQSFKDCTVLTIAHRLHTIIDSDKIMILDAGKLGEMDSPDNLLSMPNGIFKSLWDQHQASHLGGH